MFYPIRKQEGIAIPKFFQYEFHCIVITASVNMHTKYQCSKPNGFRQTVFYVFFI